MVYTYISIRVYIHVHMYICIYIDTCMFIYIHILYICIYIYRTCRLVHMQCGLSRLLQRICTTAILSLASPMNSVLLL